MSDKEYIRTLEERIEILEIIVNAILRFNFPDDDGHFRNHFTLYGEFEYDAYNKDEEIKNAIDQLEYIILKRSK